MENFKFQNPTKIIFGKDATDQLSQEMAKFGRKVLLVYGGGSIRRSGLYGQVVRQLADKQVFELGGVEPNPRLSTAHEGIRICKEQGIEFILAVGGGSVLDCAKAISIGARYNGDVWDFYKGKAYPKEAVPIGTVLTLAATGSEMNGNSVITNWETKEKIGFANVLLLHPVFSILDPANTFSVPRDQTANGCADMVAHLFEVYFSGPDNSPVADGIAEALVRTAFQEVFAALEKPDDYDARANLMWCGTMALNNIVGCGKSGDWACHMIEHSLSAHYDIAHGAGLAIVIPSYMKYMSQFKPEKYRQYAVNVFGIDPAGRSDQAVALEGIARTRDIFKKMGCPVTLAEVGIGEEKLELMARQTTAGGKLGCYAKIGPAELLEILRDCQ